MKKSKSIKSVLLICAFGFLIILVVYNLIAGLTIKKIGIPGIFEIVFEPPALPQDSIGGSSLEGEITEEERQQGEKELDSLLVEYEEELVREDDTKIVINVNGTWNGDNGATYVIQQNGKSIIIQEMILYFDVPMSTMIGQGIIEGSTIDISYNTFTNTWGNGKIEISADGRNLVGTFYDQVTQNTVIVNMYR